MKTAREKCKAQVRRVKRIQRDIEWAASDYLRSLEQAQRWRKAKAKVRHWSDPFVRMALDAAFQREEMRDHKRLERLTAKLRSAEEKLEHLQAVEAQEGNPR